MSRLECTLFCKAFRSVDPATIGRYLGSALELTNASDGRTVWVVKSRGDRLVRARMEPGITRDQIHRLIAGELTYQNQTIRCEQVEEVEDIPEAMRGKRIKRESIEELCLPWLPKPYPEQLEAKKQLVIEALATALKKVHQSAKQRGYTPLPTWSDHEVLETLFVDSPSGYRNKCEFTIGRKEDGTPEVGFMHTRATLTTEPVVAAGETLMHVSEGIRRIVESFRSLLYANIDQYPLFSHIEKTGAWRMISIRVCPVTTQSQVLVQSGPLASTAGLETILTTWAETENITSLYVQYNGSVTDTIALSDLHEMKLLKGEKSIEMAIGDARFFVHPLSFFQTNTRACELLYDQVARWLDVGPKTTLFDVCCGVGTIGQYVALKNACASIIGVDIVQEAIYDAKSNARHNHIENACEYFAGRAEETIPKLIAAKENDSGEILAVVDPPRSGLHKNVIRAIRENEAIKRVVYVSCNPKTLSEDLMKFCEPLTSSPDEEGLAVNHRFSPSKALAVDMFPNTVHCEVVVVLVRP